MISFFFYVKTQIYLVVIDCLEMQNQTRTNNTQTSELACTYLEAPDVRFAPDDEELWLEV